MITVASSMLPLPGNSLPTKKSVHGRAEAQGTASGLAHHMKEDPNYFFFPKRIKFASLQLVEYLPSMHQTPGPHKLEVMAMSIVPARGR